MFVAAKCIAASHTAQMHAISSTVIRDRCAATEITGYAPRAAATDVAASHACSPTHLITQHAAGRGGREKGLAAANPTTRGTGARNRAPHAMAAHVAEGSMPPGKVV